MEKTRPKQNQRKKKEETVRDKEQKDEKKKKMMKMLNENENLAAQEVQVMKIHLHCHYLRLPSFLLDLHLRQFLGFQVHSQIHHFFLPLSRYLLVLVVDDEEKADAETNGGEICSEGKNILVAFDFVFQLTCHLLMTTNGAR